MKKKKNNYGLYIFIALLVAFVATGFIVNSISNHTKLSKRQTQGNTPGNLYNYGLFCEEDDKIYFSNLRDQGALYSMNRQYSDFKKISTDYVRYINSDENYIYYSRNNNLKDKASRSIFIFYSNGIYRLNKNGHNLKMLWKEPVGSMVLYKNKVYYQHYSENEKISVHCISTDGEKDSFLFDDDSHAVSLYDDKLYYAGIRSEKKLHSLSTDSFSNKVEAEGAFYNPIVKDKYVYFIDSEGGYKICRSDLNGQNKEILVSDRVCTYNFSDDYRYLYYQKDGSKQNGIYVLDMTSGASTLIMQGDFKWLNTVGSDCFFCKFDDSSMYVYEPDRGVSAFEPPVLKD